MANLAKFVLTVKEYLSLAEFVTVYIEEAHPTDGWAIPNNQYTLKHHGTLADRIDAAKLLQHEGLPCPLVVDSMTDEAQKSYGALPERLFIILNGTVLYAGARHPLGYNVEELNEKLKALTKDK